MKTEPESFFFLFDFTMEGLNDCFVAGHCQSHPMIMANLVPVMRKR